MQINSSRDVWQGSKNTSDNVTDLMAKGVAADGPVYPILISHKSYLVAIVWLIFVTMDFEIVKKKRNQISNI